MRINIEATRRDVIPAFDWIGGLIGNVLDTRIAAIRQQEDKNPLLAQHFRDQYSLEFALAGARKYRKNTGRLPKGDEFDALYSFLISAYRIHQALPQQAISAFGGQLAKAANDANGLRPFAYELAIATHLMGKGWDVEMTDYGGLAQFDFLARKDDVEIEIECKATSNDRGRKIHQQEVNRLADLLLGTTERLAETPSCHLIRVTVPDRLGSSNEELNGIAALVANAAEQRSSAADPLANVDYIPNDIASWPEPTKDAGSRLFFEQQFGLVNCHLLFHGRVGASIVAVAITSAKPDSVVKYIAREAKDAADQCSGTRPALIALNLVDQIPNDELEEMLRTPGGFHRIAAAVFESDKRTHVDSIAFTLPQRVRTHNGATSMSGGLVRLDNPQPKFECPAVKDIFRSP
ncbi:hypothetical protein [Bradyrhizobium sp. LTSP857]|uniref:hypothetical protein n=1 Tax=Bradyrhizobium sp. LTSP857 TaxID=1619231 RepID=UPI0005D1B253|nr:hypothetical protein [Bradyrhizobium sp. LTSP857]KJC45306.1 hypothetical protein UP06_14870 [Bradyrhizobium sp. LTSP857]